MRSTLEMGRCTAAFLDPPGQRVATQRQIRGGFTLVELLVTVVILGILVAISLKLTKSRETAYLTVIQSDLHNLALAQEAYFSDYGTYGAKNDVMFAPSPNVVLALSNSPSGWSARAQHQMSTNVWCAVYVGSPNPVFQPAQQAGVVSCGPKGGGGGNGAGNGGAKP